VSTFCRLGEKMRFAMSWWRNPDEIWKNWEDGIGWTHEENSPKFYIEEFLCCLGKAPIGKG
jgi:hypothetical protein